MSVRLWMLGSVLALACGGRAQQATNRIEPTGSAGQASGGAATESVDGEPLQPRPIVPGVTAQEAETLAPLSWQTQINAASLDELFQLVPPIALARGYALCRCAMSPHGAPSSFEQLHFGCARDETGLLRSLIHYLSFAEGASVNEAVVGCLQEPFAKDMQLEPALRCELARTARTGQAWLETCFDATNRGDGSARPQAYPEPCDGETVLSEALETCQFAE